MKKRLEELSASVYDCPKRLGYYQIIPHIPNRQSNGATWRGSNILREAARPHRDSQDFVAFLILLAAGFNYYPNALMTRHARREWIFHWSLMEEMGKVAPTYAGDFISHQYLPFLHLGLLYFHNFYLLWFSYPGSFHKINSSK